MLKLKREAKGKIKKVIGDGENTLIWFYNWHPLHPFLGKFESWVFYDSRLKKCAKLKEIIEGGRWKWPTTKFIKLMEIKWLMPPNPNGGGETTI